jgi:hypothetical protein
LLDHLQPWCSVCDPTKIFFTSKFSYLLSFFNPTHKTESGIANRCEITNSKPPGPIIMMGQSEKDWPAIRSYLLHSLATGQSSDGIWCSSLGLTASGYRSERRVNLSNILATSWNLLSEYGNFRRNNPSKHLATLAHNFHKKSFVWVALDFHLSPSGKTSLGKKNAAASSIHFSWFCLNLPIMGIDMMWWPACYILELNGNLYFMVKMTQFHINMVKAHYHNLVACIPWLKMKQFHINNYLQIKAYYHNTRKESDNFHHHNKESDLSFTKSN